MAKLTIDGKNQPDKQDQPQPGATGLVPEKIPVKDGPPSSDQVSHVVPLEINGAQNCIKVKVVGDFVSIEMNPYTVDHISQFRSFDRLLIEMKSGSAPVITAYRD